MLSILLKALTVYYDKYSDHNLHFKTQIVLIAKYNITNWMEFVLNGLPAPHHEIKFSSR